MLLSMTRLTELNKGKAACGLLGRLGTHAKQDIRQAACYRPSHPPERGQVNRRTVKVKVKGVPPTQSHMHSKMHASRVQEAHHT